MGLCPWTPLAAKAPDPLVGSHSRARPIVPNHQQAVNRSYMKSISSTVVMKVYLTETAFAVSRWNRQPLQQMEQLLDPAKYLGICPCCPNSDDFGGPNKKIFWLACTGHIHPSNIKLFPTHLRYRHYRVYLVFLKSCCSCSLYTKSRYVPNYQGLKNMFACDLFGEKI